MRYLSVSFLCLVMTTVTLAQTNLEKGQEWYDRRAEGANGIEAAPGPINKAIAYLEKAVEQKESQEKAAELLLRSYYYKGTYVVDDNDEKQKIFSKGKKLGEDMIETYPNSAPIKFWYAANLGRWAEAYGKMAAAREGIADKLKKLCEDVIALDPNYQEGGGYRVLGLVHFQSPYIPFVLSWPDDDEALKNLEKAIEIAPDSPNNNLQYGKVLKHEGYYEKAENYLRKAAVITPSSDRLLEERRAKIEAKKLLKDL